MSENHCNYQTYPGSYHEDPEPPEFCENVAPDGEYCPDHGGEDEPDWDQIRKDRILDEKEN